MIRPVASMVLLLLLLVLALCVVPATAQTPASSALAEQAAQAFDQGRYADAAQLYRRAAESGGEGAEVRYDLGNCYLKLGDLGRSILEYRRALAAEPSLAPAQKNLTLARSLLPAKVAPWQPSPWEAAIARVPVRGLQWLVLALALLANAGLALVILLPSGATRRGAAGLLVGALLCAGLAATALLYAKTVLPSHRPAVVLQAAPVYAGPEAQGAPLATLPAGSEVILAAKAGDRVLVLWGEGRGWTVATAVETP
jgi:tetratricopeptide (TPR) repeat protein